MSSVVYACTQRDCEVALAMVCWPVEVGADGLPTEEAEARCPECYAPGNPVVVHASAAE